MWCQDSDDTLGNALWTALGIKLAVQHRHSYKLKNCSLPKQQWLHMFLGLVSPLTLSCLSCTNAAIASFVWDSKILIEMLHVRLERELCFSKERLLSFCVCESLSLSFSLSLSSRPKTEAMPEAKR